MSQHRAFLLAALRRVIDGGDISEDELDAAIADPRALKGLEQNAWLGLVYWAEDDDIRAKKPNYGPMRRKGLADLLSRLEGEA
jgi:hypothetical protein